MASLAKTCLLRSAVHRQPIASTSKLCLCTPRYNSTTTTTSSSPSSAPSSSNSASSPSVAAAAAAAESSVPSAEATATSESDSASIGNPTPVKHSYFVPRVGKLLDSLPVYTDIRNGGTRIFTELRKIQGNVEDLKSDLSLYLAETYATNDPLLNNVDSPLKVNKKPLRPRAGRKLVEKTANPTYLNPVQTAKVQESGKLKIRGNRVEHVKAFLESRGF